MSPSNFWDVQPAIRALYGRCLEPVCRQYGISRTELDILLFLANNPAHDIAADISDLRGLAKSHVSTSLRSLDAHGYICRKPDQGDRRIVHLKCTDLAAPLIEDGRHQQIAFADALFAGFPQEDRDRFQGYLTQIYNNVKSAMEVPEK